MSAVSLHLAWLACICTSLASDDFAGTGLAAAEAKAAKVPPPPSSSPPPSKCMDTCVTAADDICQSGDWGPSGVWRELGTDCTCTTSCDNPLSPHFGVDFLFELRGRAWTVTEGCKLPSAEGCKHWNPAEECRSTQLTQVPATQYTVSFPVAATIDLAASLTKGPPHTSLWAEVRAGLQSYLQCFDPVCGMQIGPTRGGVNIEARVQDNSGNGSSTASLERAAALRQESEAAALFTSLPSRSAIKALGPVTVSAPSISMHCAAVHYTDTLEPPYDSWQQHMYDPEEIAEDIWLFGRPAIPATKYGEPHGENDSNDEKPLAQYTVKHNPHIVKHNEYSGNENTTLYFWEDPEPLTPPPPTACQWLRGVLLGAANAWLRPVVLAVKTIISGDCAGSVLDCAGFVQSAIDAERDEGARVPHVARGVWVPQETIDTLDTLTTCLVISATCLLILIHLVMLEMLLTHCKYKNLTPPQPANKVEVVIDKFV